MGVKAESSLRECSEHYPQPWYVLIWIIAIGGTALFWWGLWVYVRG